MKQRNGIVKVTSILFLMLFIGSAAFSQQPQTGFSYQAVARDDAGDPLSSQPLTVRISIHEGDAEGVLIWEEDHDVITSDLGMFNLVVGGQDGYGQSGKVESFNDIDWSTARYFLNVMVKKDDNFLDMGGSPIQTVPVAQFAQSAEFAQFADSAKFAESAKGAAGNFAVQADKIAEEGEALFEVKRSDGSIAFAVYEDMVWVYANDGDAKGIKGGFAVGGYNRTKAGPEEYLRITPDSIRMYINEEDTKGIKGGFAVGGYSSSKSANGQYLYVSGNNAVDDDYSIALGVEAEASGAYSTAVGYQATASGNSSFSAGRTSLASENNTIAIGYGARSTGLNAASMGYQSEARGERSIAIGSFYSYTFYNLPYFDLGKKDGSKNDFIIWDPIINPIFRTIYFNRANIAEGKYSIALGNGNYSLDGGTALGSNNDATGFGATAIGVSNKARNTNSFAAGYNSQADGYYATAFGNNAYARAYGSFVIGQYNELGGEDTAKWKSNDPLFVVGNGLNEDNRSNAFTIHKDGKTIIKGADASLTVNERINFSKFIPVPPYLITELSVFGVKSFINCSDPDVDKYYSAYFYSTNAEAPNYQGFYADVRAGNSADIAEYIHDTKGTTEPGDVLIADPYHPVSAITSSQPFETSVIGVVSTDPHLTMGMELVIDKETGASLPNTQATRLALTGRVPCKVTDENGPIQPGDLLTTSSTPGHAMKWTPLDVNEATDFEELKSILAENELRRHAVIGKALESHAGGTGKIMVLVSLQ